MSPAYEVLSHVSCAVGACYAAAMRITGGSFRSRSLCAPRGERTRPTSDRVREALFAVIAAEREVEGARVLDLYAGTGALAFEALSRGAAHATIVETAPAALGAIARNVDALAVRDRVRVVASRVERAARALAPGAPYDLVFADPPYSRVASGEAARALASLVSLFDPRDLVVLEHASRDPPPAVDGLALASTRRYGDTSLSFYEPATRA